MPANIVETAQHSIRPAHHQKRLTQQIGSNVMARITYQLRPPDNLPRLPEYAARLFCEQIGHSVILRRQGAGARNVAIYNRSRDYVELLRHAPNLSWDEMDYIQAKRRKTRQQGRALRSFILLGEDSVAHSSPVFGLSRIHPFTSRSGCRCWRHRCEARDTLRCPVTTRAAAHPCPSSHAHR
jgi:hypothetical protein